MARRLLLSMLLALSFAACGRRVQPDTNCEWPPERAVRLDLSKLRDRRHLTEDALIAEDLGIRYADTHGRHWDGYSDARDRCILSLFDVIAKEHGVTVEQVQESMSWRPARLDLVVMLSFAVIYGFLANFAARQICRRSLYQDSWITAALVVLVTSVLVSLGGLMAGEVWSLIIEMFRIGNGHMSYRVDRVPWVQHRLAIFVGGILIFWFSAALQYRGAFRVAASRRHGGV